MVRRAATAAAAGLLLASCASAPLGRDDVAGVVRGAFADAGVRVGDVEVAPEPASDRWTVTATVDGRDVELEVAAGSGRITALEVGTGASPLDRDELEAIAAHDAGRAEEPARRLALGALGTLAAAVAAALVVARRLRLREDAQAMAVSRPAQ